MSSYNKYKKIGILIISIVLLTSIFNINIIQNISLDKNISNEINIKQQKQLKELVNIGTLSKEFMDTYFEEVSQISQEDNENLLIVVSKDNIKNDYGAKKIITAPNNQYYLIYNSAEEKNNAFKKLSKNSDIISVEENLIYTIDQETSNNNSNDYNSWGVEKLGYDYAINEINSINNSESERINDVIVAVIDTGLDVTSFTKKYTKEKLHSTYDPINNSETITDPDGHGTHVAGTVAETTPSNVKIMAVRGCSDDGNCYHVNLCAAINYVIQQKIGNEQEGIKGNENINVINFSIGTNTYSEESSKTLWQIIQNATDNNIIFVATAGNENNELYYYPGSYNNVITVSNIDSHFNKGLTSNYGTKVKFAAPGYRITSLDILDENGNYKNNQNGTKTKTGTSMAAPHVSGAIAILKSLNSNLNLNDTISLLKKHSIDIGDDGYDTVYGYGIVNFNDALFCKNNIVCDKYGVFQDNEINTLSTIKIEPNGIFTPEYNYGSNTNIVNAEINLYYTKDDYYTKTLSQLIEHIEIIGYEPNVYKEQNVTIKYKDLETTIIVDNSKMEKSGWEYKTINTNENKSLELTKINYTIHDGTSKIYTVTDMPQVIYIPSEIDGKKITSIGENIFKDSHTWYTQNLKRIIIPEGIETIKDNAFSISEEHYKTQIITATNDFYRLFPLEIVLPKSINKIDKSAFDVPTETSKRAVFYTYNNSEDSTAYKYAVDNNIDHLYVDKININLSKKEYKVFDEIDKKDLIVTIDYKGTLDTINSQILNKYTKNYSTDNDNLISLSEVINNYTIKYNEENTSLRNGDTSFKIVFNNNVGQHFEEEVFITVNKLQPEYTIPDNLVANINQKLSEIILPEGFQWMNPDEIIKEDGNMIFKAIYIPSDTDNYETIENIDISIYVNNPKKIIEPNIVIKDKTYDGTTKISIDNITISNLEKSEYTIENITSSSSDVGSTTATIKLKLTDETYQNYTFDDNKQEKEFTINFKIIPQELEKPKLKENHYIYNGLEQSVMLNNYQEDKMNISGNKRTNAGEQDVIISLKNNNYIWNDNTSDDVILKFKIDKAAPNIKYLSYGRIIKYDGKSHGINLEVNSPNNTIIKYMNSSGKYILDEMPKYSEIGTYIIKFKLFINDNYTEIFDEEVLTITNNTINNNTTDFETIYDGKEHTINLDFNLENYNIKYSINNYNYNLNELPTFKEVGEYTINYKITSYNYDDLTGSNKVKIYGIKSFNKSIKIKNNILILSNNNFNNLRNNINIYSQSNIFNHLDNKKNIISSNTIKTGDYLNIKINNSKTFEYQLAYIGDVNGNGEIDIFDYIRIMKDIMDITKLSGTYKEAADITQNGEVDIFDYIRIMKKIMEEN